MTAGEIQAAIDTLDAQIAAAGSVQATSHADQSTTFRSVDELRKLRADLVRQLNAASGTSSTRYVATSKGV